MLIKCQYVVQHWCFCVFSIFFKLFACFVNVKCDLVHDTKAIFRIRLPQKDETILDAVNS